MQYWIMLELLWLAACVWLVTSVKESRYNQGLTAIPADIPDSVTELELSRNDIREINSTAYYPVIVRFYINYNNLEEFPNFCILNQTLNHIQIEHNKISSIESVRMDCLQVLKTLRMRWNRLSHFPSVNGMANSLQLLWIGYNYLTEVPRIDIIGPKINDLIIGGNPMNLNTLSESFKQANLEKVTKLWVDQLRLNLHNFDKTVLQTIPFLSTIYIFQNDFTEIPDFSASKNTLSWLNIHKNPITFIDPKTLRKYTKLRTLNCNDCLLTTVPNACTINNNPPLTLHLSGNPFICDYKSKWMILAYTAGMIVLSANPCSEPPHLTAVDKNNLVADDFQLYEGTLRSRTTELFNPEHFSCFSVMGQLDALPGLTPIECVSICLKTPKCLAVGNHGNNQTCVIYGPGSGLSDIPKSDFFIL